MIDSKASYQVPSSFCEGVFRAYDIRGKALTELSPDLVYALGLAFGTNAYAADQHTVIAARDGRLSSPQLFDALVQGLLTSGVNVLNIGMLPSPLMYFATHFLTSKTGVIVTGSHNPKDDNGLKMILNGQNLTEQALSDMCDQIKRKGFRFGAQGQCTEVEVMEAYVERIKKDIQLTKQTKVVIDCGNGVTGVVAEKLFTQIGADVIMLYDEVDGHFPNHHPDPTIPKNIQDLQSSVVSHQADIGVAFDGDGDRMVAVTHDGRIFWPEQQLMLFSKQILEKYPGTDVVYDVKCSQHLATVIKQHGGRPVMARTGHSLIKAEMQRCSAMLAGELSGHIFFADDWYGFDDGMYTAARLLALLDRTGKTLAQCLDALPTTVQTPELHIDIDEQDKFACVEAFKQNIDFSYEELITLDGVRIECEQGWALVRASNTTPKLTIRFEADNAQAMSDIQSQVASVFQQIRPKLLMPF